VSQLHQAFSKTMREYEASAKSRLSSKLAKLQRSHASIREFELQEQRSANLTAIQEWCSDPAMMVENLQILSMVHNDMSAVLGNSGTYCTLTRKFEIWRQAAEDRLFGSVKGSTEPLSEEWRNDHEALVLKIQSIQRDMGVLPPPISPQQAGEKTALEIVFQQCKSLLDGMLEELEIMVEIEKEVMAQERQRVKVAVDRLVLQNTKSSTEWVPIWTM
jgi:hypothetical protein